MRPEDLIQKLVETGHLNVPERQELGLNIVPGTAVIHAIENVVVTRGKYPTDLDVTDDFDGVCLESKPGGKYLVTVKAEYSYNRFKTFEEKTFTEIRAAAEFAARKLFKDNIDGIGVDWGK